MSFWRLSGVHFFIPCVAKSGTIAVLALGQRSQGEPLSSEDMALLSAVAAQAAIALENGRLYRQLRTKADELERMRQFSENILESLNDGLAVLALLVITTLGVYKPWGRTRYGRRMQEQPRGETGLPIGFKIFLVIVSLIVAVFLVVHLAGGGLHHGH